MNEHIREMAPYASARDEFTGRAEVYLDANESWYGGNEGINRYPDPRAVGFRKELEKVMGFPFDMTAIGNGSDEIIDMLIRIFCTPGRDSVMISRPTYGEYKVLADLNNVQCIDVPLCEDLSLDTDRIIGMINERSPKIVFICSPNNPTGRVYPLSDILRISAANKGITVVDEAYADFASGFESAVGYIKDNPRIVVMRTMSKAWALAGARVGIMIADPEIQKVFIKTKAPYNVSSPAQKAAVEALLNAEKMRNIRDEIISERERLSSLLPSYPFVVKVYPSETNFILVKVDNAGRLYDHLLIRGIIVRNRSHEPLLDNCLRLTVGSKEENDRLLEGFDEYIV